VAHIARKRYVSPGGRQGFDGTEQEARHQAVTLGSMLCIDRTYALEVAPGRLPLAHSLHRPDETLSQFARLIARVQRLTTVSYSFSKRSTIMISRIACRLLLGTIIPAFCYTPAVVLPEEPASAPQSKPDEQAAEGFTRLHTMAIRGDVATAKKLVEAGADVNAPQAKFKGAPLQYAAAGGRVEFIKFLLKHEAVVDSVDANGRTPLIWAAQEGKTEAVKALLDADANIGAANDGGWTPLHYAMSYGHEATAQLLLERGASKDLLNRDGKTPLDVKGANVKADKDG
jgi:hypothetical protein